MILSFGFALLCVWYSLRWAINYAKAFLDARGKKIQSCHTGHPLSALLVTAHPDDECMFFAPIIRKLVGQGIKVRILCLSTGQKRKSELARSCSVLEIAEFKIVDKADLQDSLSIVWDPRSVAREIASMIEDHGDINTILTFDSTGVSGHPNHKDAFSGVLAFLEDHQGPFHLFVLESLPLMIKYIGPLGLVYEAVNMAVEELLAKLSGQTGIDKFVAGLDWEDVVRYTFGSMRQHKSQLVWFRYLYLIFSRYVYVNTLLYYKFD